MFPQKSTRIDDFDLRGRSRGASPEGKKGRETLLWRILNFEKDSHDVVKQHMPRFFENRRQNLEELRRSLEQSRLEEVRKLSHLFRASASMMGFGYLATLASQLEERAQLADQPACRAGLVELTDEFHRLEGLHERGSR